MNVFVFCFLTTAVVTAAPRTSRAPDKHHNKSGNYSAGNLCQIKGSKDASQQLLKEIMHDVTHLKQKLTKTVLQKDVKYVFNNETCSCERLCEAQQVLSVFNHSMLGLSHSWEWRLPRRLKAYTQMQKCTSSSELVTVPLVQLLGKIHTCAQKEYTHI